MSPPAIEEPTPQAVYALTETGGRRMQEDPRSDLGQFLVVCEQRRTEAAIKKDLLSTRGLESANESTIAQHEAIAALCHIYIEHALVAGWIIITFEPLARRILPSPGN